MQSRAQGPWCWPVRGALRGVGPLGTVDLGAGGVGIPSNLLISSGCLGLSDLNLIEGRGGGLQGAGSRGPLVGLGGLVHKAVGGLVQGAGVRGVGGGLF